VSSGENGEEEPSKRRNRYQQAAASAAGAGVGAIIGGPVGAVVGAALGPLLGPLAEKVWAEVSADGERRGGEALAAACEALDRGPEELEGLVGASDKTRLLAGIALSAATRTAWQAKVRTLGRSLASGLLAADEAKIDIEQLIIAAIADIEAPHLSLLELLVCREPVITSGALVAGRHQVPDLPGLPAQEGWRAGRRIWIAEHIGTARQSLRPILPSLLGTLQRHGLAVQNDNTARAIQRYADTLRKDAEQRLPRPNRSNAGRSPIPRVLPSTIKSMTPAPSWSPTELGEQVLGRFREASADVPDGWVF
jgi:hypothetical protein